MEGEQANVATDELTQIEEPAVEVTEPEVDYRAEAERLKAEKEQAEANLKAVQRNLSDREAKLQSERERNRRFDEKLDQSMQYTAQLAKLVQTNLPKVDDMGNPIQYPSANFLDFDEYRRQQEVQKVIDEVKEYMAEKGLDPVKDFDEVRMGTENPIQAMRKADKIARERAEAEAKKQAEEAEKAQKEKQAVEEAERKRQSAAEKGELDMPTTTGKAVGGIPRDPEAFNRWVENLSPEEYQKMRPELLKRAYG